MTIPLTLWQPPPAICRLAAGQVDVWRFRLDLPMRQILHYRETLDDGELARAERLLDKELAYRFIAAHGRLREILARYLDRAEKWLEFSRGPFGKPELAGEAQGALAFSLAHSEAWGLLAVAASGQLGVDVERLDPGFSWPAVAARYFSARERALLANLPPARRRRGFYRCWVRREAVMKMSGTGFAGARDAQWREDCQVRVLPVGKGCLGAVAFTGETNNIRCIDLS